MTHLITELEECSACELRTVVSDDSVWHPEAEDDPLDELDSCMLMTHKYRGSQQSLREVKPKFIDSTQGEPKDIYKP